ncbi:hypothetical protein CK203_037956 [Vitis vinifera]|uniref:Uncharacterized protein n=1 Tax=Vitis vinifera TaxID=29760 RepID=A0A438HNU7_VITVI|nr:hypothetical protein CK203_037956 [Vitis vinifera]
MYVELTTPRIVAWNDFFVKQRIKLELEMLGGFGKVKLVSTLAEQDQTKRNEAPAVDDPVDPNEIEDVDATQRQITDAQSHVSSLIASYNHDMKVLKTCFTSSHYHTDEGQPSSSYEHVNESGAPFDTNNAQHSPVHSGGQRTSFEDGIGLRCFAYGGYGVTQEQLQCLVGERFIDILEICGSMSKSTSKSTLKKRLGAIVLILNVATSLISPYSNLMNG